MLSFSLKDSYNGIPAGVRSFLKKALLLAVSWMVIYQYVLLPSRVPDKWLTNATATVTAFALGKCYAIGFTLQPNEGVNGLGENIKSVSILLKANTVISIADACNGLKLFVLYIGFILCIPATVKRVLRFAVGGIVAIFLLNILRCFALVWLWLNKPSWVDFAHHYVFTLLVYSCIFSLWVWYGKKQPAYEKA